MSEIGETLKIVLWLLPWVIMALAYATNWRGCIYEDTKRVQKLTGDDPERIDG